MGPLRYFSMVGILVVCLFSAGCRTSTPEYRDYHMSEDVDFSTIHRVAVLPFQNFSSERNAEDMVRQLVISELLAANLVEVTVPGDANAAIEKMGIKTPAALDAEQIKALGSALKVQAVILGSVDRFGEARTGTVSAPEVALTLMMAETNAGTVVWSVTKSEGGASFMARYFGARTATMSEATLKVVRESIQTLIGQRQ